jgi:transcriptional regulator ATRX
MLNKNGTHIAQALSSMRNPRRIALTGTPLQNNLAEYFTMVHWIKPGLLAKSEAEFDRIYTKRITSSLMVRDHLLYFLLS